MVSLMKFAFTTDRSPMLKYSEILNRKSNLDRAYTEVANGLGCAEDKVIASVLHGVTAHGVCLL